VVRVALEPGGSAPTVEGADGVRLTAPVVDDAERGELYLRVVLLGTRGTLRLRAGASTVTKELATAPAAASIERAAGWAALFAPGREPQIPPGSGIAAVRLGATPATVRVAGLRLPWWSVWLGVSALAALVVERRFRVLA